VAKLKLSAIIQETDEAAVLEDIEEGAMAGRDKFSKLLETHAELTAQLFFLKQLQVGNLKASTEAAAYKELKSGNTELCVALEQDEFTKNRIHGIADELERELAKVTELDEAYRAQLVLYEDKEATRKERRALKRAYDDAVQHEENAKGLVEKAQEQMAEQQGRGKKIEGERAAVQNEVEELHGLQEGVKKEYSQALAWYEAMTGIRHNLLAGITLCPDSARGHSISFQVAAPLGNPQTAINTSSIVKVCFDKEHVVMTDIQVQSTSGVPCTDLAVHAIKLNDWQMFLQEYHFRCLNVALTEQEVKNMGDKHAVTWLGMSTVATQGFSHLFEAKVDSKCIRLVADLEYPQSHSIMHHIKEGNTLEELDCTSVESAQGSKVCAVLDSMEVASEVAQVA